MDVWGTMQAGTDRDLEGLIEDAADLGSGKCFAAQAQGADAAGHVAMAEDFVAADLVEAFPQAFDEFDFVPVNLGEALLGDIFDAGGEAGDAEDVGCAA